MNDKDIHAINMIEFVKDEFTRFSNEMSGNWKEEEKSKKAWFDGYYKGRIDGAANALYFIKKENKEIL